MTREQYKQLGKRCKKEYNLMIGSFAADLVGESYPFSEPMTKIVFKNWNTEDLGRAFVKWCNIENEELKENRK